MKVLIKGSLNSNFKITLIVVVINLIAAILSLSLSGAHPGLQPKRTWVTEERTPRSKVKDKGALDEVENLENHLKEFRSGENVAERRGGAVARKLQWSSCQTQKSARGRRRLLVMMACSCVFWAVGVAYYAKKYMAIARHEQAEATTTLQSRMRGQLSCNNTILNECSLAGGLDNVERGSLCHQEEKKSTCSDPAMSQNCHAEGKDVEREVERLRAQVILYKDALDKAQVQAEAEAAAEAQRLKIERQKAKKEAAAVFQKQREEDLLKAQEEALKRQTEMQREKSTWEEKVQIDATSRSDQC